MCKIFLTYFYVSQYLVFFCLANFRNKLLLCRLTLCWGEMNLIGQLFIVGSPGLTFDRGSIYMTPFSKRDYNNIELNGKHVSYLNWSQKAFFNLSDAFQKQCRTNGT